MPRKADNYNEYMRVYILARYHRRMDEARKFLGGKCVFCGAVDKLELDHIDSALKTGTVSQIWSYSSERFWTEVKKCQLLCGPGNGCHLAKSRKQGDVRAEAKHGSPGMYRHHKCRCQVCRKGNATRSRRYKQRAKLETPV